MSAPTRMRLTEKGGKHKRTNKSLPWEQVYKKEIDWKGDGQKIS